MTSINCSYSSPLPTLSATGQGRVKFTDTLTMPHLDRAYSLQLDCPLSGIRPDTFKVLDQQSHQIISEFTADDLLSATQTETDWNKLSDLLSQISQMVQTDQTTVPLVSLDASPTRHRSIVLPADFKGIPEGVSLRGISEVELPVDFRSGEISSPVFRHFPDVVSAYLPSSIMFTAPLDTSLLESVVCTPAQASAIAEIPGVGRPEICLLKGSGQPYSARQAFAATIHCPEDGCDRTIDFDVDAGDADLTDSTLTHVTSADWHDESQRPIPGKQTYAFTGVKTRHLRVEVHFGIDSFESVKLEVLDDLCDDPLLAQLLPYIEQEVRAREAIRETDILDAGMGMPDEARAVFTDLNTIVAKSMAKCVRLDGINYVDSETSDFDIKGTRFGATGFGETDELDQLGIRSARCFDRTSDPIEYQLGVVMKFSCKPFADGDQPQVAAATVRTPHETSDGSFSLSEDDIAAITSGVQTYNARAAAELEEDLAAAGWTSSQSSSDDEDGLQDDASGPEEEDEGAEEEEEQTPTADPELLAAIQYVKYIPISMTIKTTLRGYYDVEADDYYPGDPLPQLSRQDREYLAYVANDPNTTSEDYRDTLEDIKRSYTIYMPGFDQTFTHYCTYDTRLQQSKAVVHTLDYQDTAYSQNTNHVRSKTIPASPQTQHIETDVPSQVREMTEFVSPLADVLCELNGRGDILDVLRPFDDYTFEYDAAAETIHSEHSVIRPFKTNLLELEKYADWTDDDDVDALMDPNSHSKADLDGIFAEWESARRLFDPTDCEECDTNHEQVRQTRSETFHDCQAECQFHDTIEEEWPE